MSFQYKLFLVRFKFTITIFDIICLICQNLLSFIILFILGILPDQISALMTMFNHNYHIAPPSPAPMPYNFAPHLGGTSESARMSNYHV
jgi:hypothetical protein